MRTYNYLENNHKLHGNVAERWKCPLQFRICFIFKKCRQFMFDSAGHRITVGCRKATPACHRVKVVSLPSDRIDSPRSTLLCESHVEQVISERRTFAADHRTSTVSSSKAFWILEDMARRVDSSGRSGG